MGAERSTAERTVDAEKLVKDLELDKDAEYFADPENRLQFFESIDFDEFFDLAQHVNARMRGLEPREGGNHQDQGAYLPMLATPLAVEKRPAFEAGFNTIQRYLKDTDDSIEERVRGLGMATEALIIWVHPFNDGNGRTSRFFGKFIDDGTEDIGLLVGETADKNARLRMYYESLRVDQGNMVKDLDLILEDDEIEEYKKTEMPIADGISLSIDRLLRDKSYQDKVDATTARLSRHKQNTLAA